MPIEMSNAQAVLLQKMNALESIAQNRSVARGGGAAFAAPGGDFGGAMKLALDRVNAQQNHASALTTAVDTGASDDLVGAMIASQKAGLSFSALLQVRNKLMSGFDEIMRLPL